MKKYFILIFFLFSINPLYANNSWNGNASIVGHNSGSNKGYGLTYDISKVHSTSPDNPVVFFQWQRDHSDGKNLRITAESDYSSATITYGYWDSPRTERTSHKNVSLPFILDPTTDGFSSEDGSWFIIAVSFKNNPQNNHSTIKAEATDKSGTNYSPVLAEQINLGNNSYWSGNGSLISYASGNKHGYGLTYDIAAVYPDIKSSVFFQWEIDSSDGKSTKISSDNGCFNQVKITTGQWSSREYDSSIIVNLPYIINTTKDDGHWVLIRVDLLNKPSCHDAVRAEIIQTPIVLLNKNFTNIDYNKMIERYNNSLIYYNSHETGISASAEDFTDYIDLKLAYINLASMLGSATDYNALEIVSADFSTLGWSGASDALDNFLSASGDNMEVDIEEMLTEGGVTQIVYNKIVNEINLGKYKGIIEIKQWEWGSDEWSVGSNEKYKFGTLRIEWETNGMDVVLFVNDIYSYDITEASAKRYTIPLYKNANDLVLSGKASDFYFIGRTERIGLTLINARGNN